MVRSARSGPTLAGDDHWRIMLCVRREDDLNQASPSPRSRIKSAGEVLLGLLWLVLGVPLAWFVMGYGYYVMFRLFPDTLPHP